MSFGRAVIALGCALVLPCSAVGCSSDDGDGSAGNATLQGVSCVDANDTCCCESELEVAAPSGSATCRYGFAGQLEGYTFELVSARTAVLLARVDSEAACGAQGGWYATLADSTQYADLCPATCSQLGAEQGRIRVLSGCPSQPC